jgi:hypothetical protein
MGSVVGQLKEVLNGVYFGKSTFYKTWRKAAEDREYLILKEKHKRQNR